MKKRSKKYDKTCSNFSENDSSCSDLDENSFLNVDFEFFSPRLTDVYTLRNLLRQLMGPDSNYLDLFSLSDLISRQIHVGSTVKVDGIEGDPFAFLTVINLNYHQEKLFIKQILSYIMSKISLNKEFYEMFNMLMKASDSNLGLILSERLVNMPTQIIPPMYEMLFEEIEWALEDKEPYNFSHYIILSRSCQQQKSKRGHLKKKRKDICDALTLYFHPEDEIFKKKSLYNITYKYGKSDKDSDSMRSFQNPGMRVQGELMMISKDKLKEAIDDLKSMFTE